MATGSRAQFSSRFGFLMAAAGSAVGVGNIWGSLHKQRVMAAQSFTCLLIHGVYSCLPFISG